MVAAQRDHQHHNRQPGGNCEGVYAITDGGYNLIDDNGHECGFTNSTDILNTIPQLRPLANNGGPTQTMALIPTSRAIDAVPVLSGVCPKTDQRGVSRPDNGEQSCDIGAYEYEGPEGVILTYKGPTSIRTGKSVSLAARLTAVNGRPISGRVLRMQIGRGRYAQSCVTPKTDRTGEAHCVINHVKAWTSPTPVRVWFDGDKPGPNYDYAPGYVRASVNTQGRIGVCPTTEVRLRSAITTAGKGNTVKLSCASPTTITLSRPIKITQKMTLDASGSSGAITISGHKSTELFYVTASLSLKSLTLSYGYANSGGAIFIDHGTVTVSYGTFSNNLSGNEGGAIDNVGGTLTVTNSTFSNNSVGFDGGAIANWNGTLTVRNSTFSHNSAPSQEGGAIQNVFASTATITNSTFSDNSAYSGGAILNNAGALAVTNSTFSNNPAGSGGGEIFTSDGGSLTVTGSIIAGNSSRRLLRKCSHGRRLQSDR